MSSIVVLGAGIMATALATPLSDNGHQVRLVVYNHHRGHRSLPAHATPAAVYTTNTKASPNPTSRARTHDRVRVDRVDSQGVVTLRHAGRLHHIGIGRTYTGTCIKLLIQDLDITIIDATTGEVLRELTLNPDKDYQPIGQKKKKPEPSQ